MLTQNEVRRGLVGWVKYDREIDKCKVTRVLHNGSSVVVQFKFAFWTLFGFTISWYGNFHLPYSEFVENFYKEI